MYGEKAAAMVQRLEQATWLPPYDDTMREVLTEIDELPPDECEIREQRAEAQSIKMHFDSCELAGNHFPKRGSRFSSLFLLFPSCQQPRPSKVQTISVVETVSGWSLVVCRQPRRPIVLARVPRRG